MNFEQKCTAAIKSKGLDVLDDLCPKALRIINKLARLDDNPNVYPYIKAADKAIRFYRRMIFPANGNCSTLEYILGLEGLMSDIVNGR